MYLQALPCRVHKKGDFVMKLNFNAAYNTAKELTTTAMENSMIKSSSDPKETAQNVLDFFNHVADSLNGEPDED